MSEEYDVPKVIPVPDELSKPFWDGVNERRLIVQNCTDCNTLQISVEGPHPFSSGGGNLGNGRTRTAMYVDSFEQLRGTAGKRQITVKAETAICAFAPFTTADYLCLASSAP